jgi:uncharacterized protein (TIGR02996 family)
MDHASAFLHEIREQPDDDAHRLIYADWLEEHGGRPEAARAAFIRAQCRLARLADDDPARADLEDEAAGLLAEHEDEWVAPLAGMVEDWEFRRGFVERVTHRGRDFLAHAERLFAFTPLRSLHLLIGPGDVPALAACPHLAWVEELDFRRCHLPDRSLQHLLTSPHLGRLTALYLGGNGVSTAGMHTLVGSAVLSRLTRLDLSGNRGVGDRAVRLLAQAPRAAGLQTLSLASVNLTPVGLQDLFRSARLTGLTSLDVSGVHYPWSQLASPMRVLADSALLEQLTYLDLSGSVHPGGLAVLAGSPQMARLRALHLRGIAASGEYIESLAASAHLAGLTTLDLSGNRLGEVGVRALAVSPHLANLTSLDVGGNDIRDTGARALAESPHLSRLRVLGLAENSIGGPGLRALAASTNLAHLTVLDLAGNFVGADSMRALAGSPHLGRLTRLGLGGASLEADSARVLASAPTLARLTELHLPDNRLGDEGVKALTDSPHLARLTELDLTGNRIGKAGAEALAASPRLRRLRKLDLRNNTFTGVEEELLRERFAGAVLL